MANTQPNVLLLLTDQQRADTITLDRCQTPNLDRLQSMGTRFDRCYANNPVCSPSRASIMTGELPHTHGMTHVEHTVPCHQAEFQSDLPMWSERLSETGYHLAHIGKWHVERSAELSRFGYDENLAFASDRFTVEYETYLDQNDLSPPAMPRWHDDAPATDDSDRHTEVNSTAGPGDLKLSYVLRDRGYNDALLYGTHDQPAAANRDYFAYSRACEYVREQADTEEPWCLTVSTFAPHDPYVIPQEYFEKYDYNEVEEPANYRDSMTDKPRIYQMIQDVYADMEWDHIAEAITCYYAYTTFVDDQIGRLLDALETTGQFENTVIIFASDHGDLLGSHRLFCKGAPAFEDAYRVPLVVRHPDQAGAKECDQIVQLTDLAPTLCDLANADPMDCFGSSLTPFLHGRVPDEHENEAFAEYFGQRIYWTHRVLWRDNEKYVFNGGDTDELYDLDTDPYEQNNLITHPEYRNRRETLLARLWNYVTETGDETLAYTYYPTVRYGHVGPGASDLQDVDEL